MADSCFHISTNGLVLHRVPLSRSEKLETLGKSILGGDDLNWIGGAAVWLFYFHFLQR